MHQRAEGVVTDTGAIPAGHGYAHPMREGGNVLGRLGILGATAVCALALAAPAAAKTRDYKGPIGPSGAISFGVKGKGDRTKVVELEWFRLPVECGRKDDTSSGALTFPVKVKDRKFSAYAVYGNKNHPKAEAIIRGKINGSRAHGSIIVRGSKLPVNDAGTGDCDSGKHPWNAAG